MCTTNPQNLQELLDKLKLDQRPLEDCFKSTPAPEEAWKEEALKATELSGYYKSPLQKSKGALLSDKIEAAMKAKGLNRTTFARLMKVQASVITRWLSGTHNFTVETLYGIEEKLNIELIKL